MSARIRTPGPWRWEIVNKDVRLCGGRPRYDLHVMDFVRQGMNGAQPRFRCPLEENGSFQIMTPASQFAVVAPGRAHHASWFKLLDHPDASLIAAAPELLDALRDLLAAFDDTRAAQDSRGDVARALLARFDPLPTRSPDHA